MTTSNLITALLAFSSVVAAESPSPNKKELQPPEHQVVAVYFHRTVRCPTCQRIGSLAEQAVNRGFAKEVKSGAVEFRFVDFQDKKNAEIVKQFDVKSPTLVLQNVFDGETVCWTSMPKVWQLFAKPKAFETYVHQGVAHYLQQTEQEAAKEQQEAKESTK